MLWILVLMLGCRPNVDWSQCDAERKSSDADFLVSGFRNSDSLGQSVAVADVDGDGQDDLLVGMPNFDPTPNLNNAGKVLLFLGASITDVGRLNVGGADFQINGIHEADGLGSSLGISDWDDDGFLDLWIGAHQAEGSGQDSGVVYWFSGDSIKNKLKGGILEADSADIQFQGEAAYDYAGFSMSSAGDVDGDKADDWLIGAYQADTEEKDRGKAYLLLSSQRSDFGSVVNLSEASTTFVGESVNDFAGYAVAGGVDVDKDGLSDILIGAGNHDGYEEDSGAAYLFLGASIPSGVVSMRQADVILYGERTGDWAGRTILAIPSLDKNKRGDWAISASWNDGDSNNQGALYLLRGNSLWDAIQSDKTSFSLTQADLIISGEAQEMFFAQTLAVGNLDGDRYSDLIIGSPLYDDGANADAGVVHVLLGETLKDLWNTKITSADLSHRIVGATAYDSFGESLAIGDLDGDRRGDMVFGTPHADSDETNAGTASVFFVCE